LQQKILINRALMCKQRFTGPLRTKKGKNVKAIENFVTLEELNFATRLRLTSPLPSNQDGLQIPPHSGSYPPGFPVRVSPEFRIENIA